MMGMERKKSMYATMNRLRTGFSNERNTASSTPRIVLKMAESTPISTVSTNPCHSTDHPV